MVPVSDQDMNTHLAEVSRVRITAHTPHCVCACVFLMLFLNKKVELGLLVMK